MNSRTSVDASEAKPHTRRKRSRTDHYNQLWELYIQKRDLETRNALIEAYLPIVRREAQKVATALSHVVSAQELESAGTLGLIDCIDNFDPGQGFKFVTFCTPRVRGAMLDDLRSWDWTPRATRAKLNRLERAVKKLEGECGQAPNDKEIAEEMGMSEEEVRKLVATKSRTLVSLDAPIAHWAQNDGSANDPPSAILEDKRETDPAHHLQKKEIAEIVRKMLDETELLVVTLYYYEQFNLREIGEVLRLTESRICQIRGEIVERLRKRFA